MYLHTLVSGKHVCDKAASLVGYMTVFVGEYPLIIQGGNIYMLS